MPSQPLSLNLARIVHRLMTSPRGWRVSQLQQDLGIAPRTYRKYRHILQEDFVAFRRRDGTSMVTEVSDGDERYLRLRPPREFGTASPDLELHAAAVHFARSLLLGTGVPELARAAEAITADFHAGLRDRDFLLAGLLQDADRMYVTERPPAPLDRFLEPLGRAISNRRHVRLTNGESVEIVAPLTLILRVAGFCLVVQADGGLQELDPNDYDRVEVLTTTFDYPTTRSYDPLL